MIEQIAIIGAGQMGSGIAQVCALGRYQVQLIDISQNQLLKAKKSIEKGLERLVLKGTISEDDRAQALKNLSFSEAIHHPEAVDLALEAVIENFDLKAGILHSLDTSLRSSALIASNTSSLSISKLAAITQHPERVIGVHFMNPAPVMPLVEIIRGDVTSEATYETIITLLHQLHKTAVLSQDRPGFIVNRILMPMINEAIFALYEEVASPKDIDVAMKLGTNQPMGPLELADFIGLDTCLSIMQVLHQGFGDDKYRPCPLLENYVTAGRLGKKVGRGFYEYQKEVNGP